LKNEGRLGEGEKGRVGEWLVWNIRENCPDSSIPEPVEGVLIVERPPVPELLEGWVEVYR